MKVKTERISTFKKLPSGKKLYFASDFHLGAPDKESSSKREKKIIEWLQHVSQDAAAIFLVGDLFDFWFEYQTTIPKGFVRFQGKIAELTDRRIPIHIFTGNHDLWMSDYLPKELGVEVHKNSIIVESNKKSLFVGHGDGLGPGDHTYKLIKRIFTFGLSKWSFQWLHPNLGVRLAQYWSNRSRSADEKGDHSFKNEKEMLFQFCQEMESKEHHDYYVFGHRHLPLEMKVSENSTYLNLGEWINHCTYVEFDGKNASIKSFND